MKISEATESIVAQCPDVSRSKIKRAFSDALKRGVSIPAAYRAVLDAAHGGVLEGREVSPRSFDPTEHEARRRTQGELGDESHGAMAQMTSWIE